MPLSVILASAAVVAAIPLLLYALLGRESSSGRVRGNLTAGMSPPSDLREIVLTRPASERALQPLVSSLARKSRRLTPAGVIDALDRRLVLAGLSWPLEAVLITKLALAFTTTVAGIAWLVAEQRLLSLVLVPAAAAIGWLAPDLVLARRAEARQQRLREDLPDVLDQLTICVEAGLAFDAALQRVARTGRGPLSAEIDRVLQDIQLGLPRPDALQRLLDRTDVPELRQFIHAVNQADNYGVPVASVLRAQADEQREARFGRAEVRAQELPVKLVFPLVLCILPSLFIVVLGPAAMRIGEAFG